MNEESLNQKEVMSVDSIEVFMATALSIDDEETLNKINEKWAEIRIEVENHFSGDALLSSPSWNAFIQNEMHEKSEPLTGNTEEQIATLLTEEIENNFKPMLRE